MAKDQKSRNLLGDVFDVLRGDRSFVTPQMFTERHQDMSVNYDTLTIRLNDNYTLTLKKNA